MWMQQKIENRLDTNILFLSIVDVYRFDYIYVGVDCTLVRFRLLVYQFFVRINRF